MYFVVKICEMCIMATINISDRLYTRLGTYAEPFESPESVIERVLNAYDKVMDKESPVSVVRGGLDKHRIQTVHDELFQFLTDRQIIFMPRQNASDRLNQGYWFNGTDDYLVIGFYTGNDNLNKTPNIYFHMYLSEKYLGRSSRQSSPIPLSSIQLSNTVGSNGWKTKEPVINEIRKRLGRFECNRVDDNKESRWNRFYENRGYSDADYLKCIEEFLIKDKPIIDEVIRDAKNSEIGFLDQNKADRKISNINRMRQCMPR